MAEIKYTARMALTDLINGTNTEKVKEWAKNEIAKLDKKNEKRKTASGEIKAENKEIAEAILKALANGSMLSVDLAKAVGITTNKANGVAGEMWKLGMLTKEKVKVKGKGEQTAYSLPVTEEVADEEEVAEEVAED
jgi:predicted transcriptional regulator